VGSRILVAVAMAAAACSSHAPAASHAASGARSSGIDHKAKVSAPATSDALVRRRHVIGYSVRHRPIVAIEIGDADSPRRTLIVGAIHGNESAGIAVARALSATSGAHEVDLWIVPNLNPDGVTARTRANARGVDLNRNFPDGWKVLGAPGSLHYAGPNPLSEPESQAAASLLRRVRPTLGIWYHQALDVVDSSQGAPSLERRYAADTGMQLRRLIDYPGSATGYEDRLLGPTAFVVELPAGRLTIGQVRRHVHAVVDVAQRCCPALRN
jgi:protein MpaA